MKTHTTSDAIDVTVDDQASSSKTFLCSHCDRSFSSRTHLRLHALTHKRYPEKDLVSTTSRAQKEEMVASKIVSSIEEQEGQREIESGTKVEERKPEEVKHKTSPPGGKRQEARSSLCESATTEIICEQHESNMSKTGKAECGVVEPTSREVVLEERSRRGLAWKESTDAAKHQRSTRKKKKVIVQSRQPRRAGIAHHALRGNTANVIALLTKTPKAVRMFAYVQALQLSSAGGHAHTVSQILDFGRIEKMTTSSGRRRDGRNCFHLAASRGHAKVLDVLMSSNIFDRSALHAEDATGATPLHWAAANGNISTVEMLLKHGSDPSKRDSKGRLALHVACSKSNVDVAQLLLEHTDALSSKTGESSSAILLNWAAAKGHVRIVAELLKRDLACTPNAKDRYGRTAAMLACAEGHIDILEILQSAYRRRGAEQKGNVIIGMLDARDKDGNTCLRKSIDEKLLIMSQLFTLSRRTRRSICSRDRLGCRERTIGRRQMAHRSRRFAMDRQFCGPITVSLGCVSQLPACC